MPGINCNLPIREIRHRGCDHRSFARSFIYHKYSPIIRSVYGLLFSVSRTVFNFAVTAMASLPISTIAGIDVPLTDLTKKALTYVNEHNIPSTVHHSIRSAIFGLIIRGKVPHLEEVDQESIVLAALMHDLGWSTTTSINSADKRFEVDGANAARDFLKANARSDSKEWNEQRLQQVWDSIALHATPSIAMYGQPIVTVVAWGIVADFCGPETPGGVISVDEYKEVVKAYPRIGFLEQTTEILCGLCKTKPETTYDNFVGDFGRAHVDGYRGEWEKRRMNDYLPAVLKACEKYEN